MPEQIDLFEDVLQAYAAAKTLSNDSLYKKLEDSRGIPEAAWKARKPIGEAKVPHSTLKRSLRWYQHNRELAGMDTQPCIDAPWTPLQQVLVSFESFHQRLFSKRSASGRRHRPGSCGQVTHPKGRPQRARCAHKSPSET